MRFKNINIEERSRKYSDVQKESLQNISNSLNKIGEYFDIIVEFEKFIVKDIRKELNDYFNIRENKQKIVDENGNDYYINEVFLPIVDKLENKMLLAVENWDTNKSDYSLVKLQSFVNILKNMYKGIEHLIDEDSNIETFKSIQELINVFGNFIVYKSVTAEDRAKRIENLFYLKEELDNAENKIENVSNGKKDGKRLTIDDL